MSLSLLLIFIICISAFLTGGVRRYAIKKSIIDIPNSRSSHVLPTPRGGGVAIVFSYVVGLFFLSWLEKNDHSTTFALLGSGIGVAILGFLDDHGHIAARWRLLGHSISAIWGLFWVGGFPPITLFGYVVNIEWVCFIFAVFYLIWVLNLYNFMDGIDGIASIECISVCLSVVAIYIYMGHMDLIWPPLLLACAVSGFLCWNFPPARIFMGDAGSGFLGVVLGIMSITAAWAAPELFWVWLILMGVFIVDATYTLLVRLFRRCKVYEAHRSHAYQIASRKMGGHLPVTLIVLGINLLWLFPVTLAMVFFKIDGLVAVFVAYLPLVVLEYFLGAGMPESKA